jgi:hypothetical protein
VKVGGGVGTARCKAVRCGSAGVTAGLAEAWDTAGRM